MPAKKPQLTERECDTLRLFAQGLTHATIAKVLGVAECTVANNDFTIRLKLRKKSRTDLIAVAVQKGLIATVKSQAIANRTLNFSHAGVAQTQSGHPVCGRRSFAHFHRLFDWPPMSGESRETNAVQINF